MSAPHPARFNRNFSHIRAALDLIRTADFENRYTLLYSHPNPRFAGFLAAHEASLEPSFPNNSHPSYVDRCFEQCRERSVALFYPGHAQAAILTRPSEFEAIGTCVIAVSSVDALTRLEDKALFYADHVAVPVPDRSLSAPPPVPSTMPHTPDCASAIRLLASSRR